MRRRFPRLAQWVGRLHIALTAPAGALLLFFSCLYILTYQGRTNSYDGQSMFATTRALVAHDTLAISSVGAQAVGVVGRGGHFYSKYGLGQSLAELPLYLVGKVLGLAARSGAAQVAEAVAMLTNPLIMAATCMVGYGIIRRLGYTRATAIRATLVLGLATSFWPYAKTDFSEPLMALMLAVAVYCALQAAHLLGSPRGSGAGAQADLKRLDLVAGTALGIGVLTKYAAVIYVPVFVVYALLTLPGVSLQDLHSLARIVRGPWRQRVAALLVPVAVAGALDLVVNALRFGSPLATGYTPSDRPFSGPVVMGLWGLLFSPFRGLVFYDPLLFAGLLALPVMLWRRPREALFPLGLFVGSLFFYAAYWAWSGGSDWGPRYLVPVLPYLLFPLLLLNCFGPAETAGRGALREVVSRQSERSRYWLPRLRLGATTILVAVSLLVQVLGVCVNYLMQNTYWQVSLHPFGNLAASLRASPLALSIWTLRLSLQYAFLHTFALGYASWQYPFGPPYPTAPFMPQGGAALPLQFFWFTLLPTPLPAFAIGAVVLGGGMLLAARSLWRRAREAAPSSSDGQESTGPGPGVAANVPASAASREN